MILNLLAVFIVIGAVAGIYLDQFRLVIDEQCKQAGADDQTAVKALAAFNSCMMEPTVQGAIEQLQSFHLTIEQIETAVSSSIKIACKKQDLIRNCTNNLIDALDPCVDSSANVSVAQSKEYFAELTQFYCDNDSARLTEFINDGAFPCFNENVDAIRGCATQSLSNVLTMSFTEHCIVNQKFRNCMTKVFKRCPKSSSASFISEHFELVFKTLRCEI